MDAADINQAQTHWLSGASDSHTRWHSLNAGLAEWNFLHMHLPDKDLAYIQASFYRHEHSLGSGKRKKKLQDLLSAPSLFLERRREKLALPYEAA